MESSGDEEECRSSESGWTMYLGSPIEEDSGSTDDGPDNDEEEHEYEEEQSDCDNAGSVHGGDKEEDRDVGDEDGDGNDHNGRDSDDSMASDASSRPCHPGFLSKIHEKTKQGKGSVQGRGKLRKNLKMGKNK